MSTNYNNYVAMARRIASERGIKWHLAPTADGKVPRKSAWELNGLCGTPPPPRLLLSDLGADEATRKLLNKRLELNDMPPIAKSALSAQWQDLIKAAVLDQIFVQGSQARHALLGIVRPLRVIGTCAENAEPWELTAEHISLAYELAEEIQASGQLARVVHLVARQVIDYNHIALRSPLVPTSERRQRGANVSTKSRSVTPRRDPSERKGGERLPDKRSFWELTRIAFTEQPQSFLDELRFAQVKLLILCGLRIGEVCLIPSDWRRTREYVDMEGRPAGEVGGMSQSTILRYFAEKRSLEDEKGTLLFPEIQHIPPIFEGPLTEALDRVSKLTGPLRERLKQQVETGRILPEFEPDQLVPVTDLFPYLSGNPFVYPDPCERDLVERYKQTFDIEVLHEIQERQKRIKRQGAEVRNEVRIYFARARHGRQKELLFYTKHGEAKTRGDYVGGHFRIDELEAFIRSNMRTKLSDTENFRSTLGELQIHQLLFLNPKRALSEERNDGICDINRYCFVGRISPEDLLLHLGGSAHQHTTLYSRYSKTNSDRTLSINSHAFRHLQNTELFRLGIADTVITKRFGRTSVAQSYEYDHRTLAEELDAIDLPDAAEAALGSNAQEVLRLIGSGKITGPLVDQFRTIQKDHGDAVAFEFLAAEADGFHTTPYGFCINSFTVDPCPKHLECYNGCRHLAATELPEHRTNLSQLRDQLKVAVETIEARPSGSVGRDNQLAHARVRLENLSMAMQAAPGSKPFPDGPDLSDPLPTQKGSVLDV